jgi:hypothetical protein
MPPKPCEHEREHLPETFLTDAPSETPCRGFSYARIRRPADLPPPDPRIVDVAILDMNHGYANLGHDSLVHLVLDVACELGKVLEAADLHVRVLSFEVRHHHQVPEAPGGRFGIYLGTGGPGHLDPAFNRPDHVFSQGLTEDPAWLPAYRALIQAIRADPDAVLLAVCHTFGVLCWLTGIARPVLRGPDKGGKSTGVPEIALTPEGLDHPWFGRFRAGFLRGDRLRVMDSRLFDLIPTGYPLPDGAVPIAHETLRGGAERGDALTMVELARDRGGVMPRIFAVNHHPEIVDRARQLVVLDKKWMAFSSQLPAGWYEERLETLTRRYHDEDSDRLLQFTSDLTLLDPLRFHLTRQVRLRAERLGVAFPVHEGSVLDRARG